jgi:hypothetical protein
VDAQGLLQGPVALTYTDCVGDSRRIGHYRDGVADGAFSGPEGGATYVHGLLEGTCQTASFDTLVYRQGHLDGPFTWNFDVHVDMGPEADADSRGCHSVQRPVMTIGGTATGTFANGVAVDKLVIRHRDTAMSRGRMRGEMHDDRDKVAPATWSEREVTIEPGVPVYVPELGEDPKTFAELLGPAHRSGSWLKCAYDNDSVVHRSPPG